MSFNLIKGTFHVKGYRPDGDSIRFEACNPSNWKKLSGPPAELNARGHAQLRMEAIDAPETHFKGFHQPLQQAHRATGFLLSGLGINEVVWNKSQGEILYAEDGTDGYILARSTERNRRPVAFVFAGQCKEKDGSEVFLENDLLKESLNYKLMARGLVYPAYYNGLFYDLREELTNASAKARSEGKGLWPQDKSKTGFSADLEGLTGHFMIFPKLFRRLIEHFRAGGDVTGFKGFLSSRCEPVAKISKAHFTRFDALIEVDGDGVRLAEAPENLIFLDKVLCKKLNPPA
jgi:endonuclease YncB( thermonuclease family)